MRTMKWSHSFQSYPIPFSKSVQTCLGLACSSFQIFFPPSTSPACYTPPSEAQAIASMAEKPPGLVGDLGSGSEPLREPNGPRESSDASCRPAASCAFSARCFVFHNKKRSLTSYNFLYFFLMRNSVEES